ncbi:MAG: zinc ribbon domain-containing protein [Verrucomicrobiota bacterium]
MPLFEFSCDKCEKEFELLVRSAKSEDAACPHCGSKKLQKKLSVFASAGAPSSKPTTSAACGMKPRRHGGGCGCC